MPKRENPNQISLFPTTDDVARATHKSDDEKNWEKERSRRSKRNQVKPNPMPASGPACGRCQHWTPPMSADDRYGICRIRVVTTERRVTPIGIIKKGVCLGVSPDGVLEIGPGMPLRYPVPRVYQHCGPAWSCSGYVDAGEGRRAA